MPQSTVDEPIIKSKNLFPVVGIGASAGGLVAFKQLIKAISIDSGMAYILVQHLHPEHESALPDILQKETKIPVMEITDQVHVEPNHIYTIPSNKMLVATDGILNLSPRSAKDDPNKPIDLFFSSLAEVHQSHAIGVVLSGTGTDGTAGLKDIKDQGGLTFAQEPASAAYDGMPQSAIDAETVDYVLLPESIPQQLITLKESFRIFSTEHDFTASESDEEDGFRKILALLRVQKGADFTHYKQTTIRRRIIRRMVMLKLEEITDYVDYLKNSKTEYDLLFQDMLIPVTSFFRDAQIFNALCEKVLPALIKNKSAYSPLRIWTAGCSTGQEAYSIAICVNEYLSNHNSTIKVQIFASDVSEKAILKARSGLYIKKELEGISASRLLQYFDLNDGQYQVKKAIRDMCVFACHNFLKDPPFAKMDLISCRNVLIYLEPFLQKKALTTFHYALNEKGILWLGKSETTGSASDLFIDHDKKNKLYSRKSISGRHMNVVSERNETVYRQKDYAFQSQEGKISDFQKRADTIVLSKYTPVGVIVNEQLDIVQFRGSTGEYLEPSPGKASLNVLKMAREGLSFEIRSAFQKSRIWDEPFIKEGIPLNKGKKLVTIEIIPLPDTLEPYYLILFRDSLSLSANMSVAERADYSLETIKSAEYLRILQLEKELAQNRENMRDITDEQETSNEVLQSANEELLSGSEELQSLNEELETSKEELQSTNEELLIVNQELQDSNQKSELNRRFAEEAIATLHEPLLILGENYIIKSANDAFYKVFQLTEEETEGKLLFDLQQKGWEMPQLRSALLKVKKEKEKLIVVVITHTFPSIGEHTICFNIKPIYRENGEQLILLALNDITIRKRAEKVLKDKADGVLEDRQLLHDFFMQTPAMLCILTGPEHTFEFANAPYRELIGNRNPVGNTIKDALPELEGQGYHEILDKVYQTGKPYIGKEMPVSLLRGGKMKQVFVDFNYQAFKDKEGRIEGILVFCYDITEQVIARNKIKESESRFRNLINGLPAAVCVLDGEGYIKLYNEAAAQLWGRKPEIGRDKWCGTWKGFTTDGISIPLDQCPMAVALKEGRILNPEIVIQRPDGVKRHMIPYPQLEYDAAGKISGGINTLIDITDQVMARKEVERSEAMYSRLISGLPVAVYTCNVEGYIKLYNEAAVELWGREPKPGKELWCGSWKIFTTEGKPLPLDECPMAIALKEGRIVHTEIVIQRPDGVKRHVIPYPQPEYDSEGNITGAVNTLIDITEQVLKEKQKDDFISIASHEMKTPLSTAKAYLQLLEGSLETTSEKSNLYVNRAGNSIDKLNGLISELLDVSKIQHGKLNYKFSTFNFNEMLDSAIEAVQYISPDHSIIKSGKILEEVYGDKDRLYQVVDNLLNNAVKYSPNAFKVFIHMEHVHNGIKVTIKDGGIGISKDNLEKIFEKYHRVEDPSLMTQGLGIGLFISYEIIQRHDGKLWAESETGKGSTFYFTLPVNAG
ncbi:MAG TPA: CheR family methyltransferase [Arachidicoccus sp.]|nr:CheR family methyltransferase [Arachidicoccus sp.]